MCVCVRCYARVCVSPPLSCGTVTHRVVLVPLTISGVAPHPPPATGRQQSVTNAKTVLDNCMASSVSNDPYTDPYTDGPADVCNCFVLYESYEALLGMCDEAPAEIGRAHV